MVEAAHPSLYTIPLHRAFADALVHGLIAQHHDGALGLANGMILLPNNRAVVAVRDAFIRAGGEALLLPRLVTIGDGDLDDAAGASLDRVGGDEAPLPPVIDPLERRLAMARMIGDLPDRAGIGALEALRLADGLAAVLDALAYEEISPAAIDALDADGFLATHWGEGLALLRRMTREWPERLAALGAIDRAEQRNRLLNQTAERWRAHGLPRPWVVAAGITTAAPAIARLLRVVAFARGGAVILPHVDLAMDDDVWASLGAPASFGEASDGDGPRPLEVHPQYHLKLLLDRIGVGRGEVEPWDWPGRVDGPPSRVAFAAHLLAPAEQSSQWPKLPAAAIALPGVTAYDCANPAEEALTIALAMREALETPGKTVALVTPDRDLAARVSAQLIRWGLVADDSAGMPLAELPAGALLLALVEAASAEFAPVELIALLSHPLVAAGEGRRRWLDQVRMLDLALRGPRPGPGLASMSQIVAQASGRAGPEVATWWDDVAAKLEPLATAMSHAGGVRLEALIEPLRMTLTALAGEGVWQGAGGRALADAMGKLADHAHWLERPLLRREWPGVVALLLRDTAVRLPQGGHPRLRIWGLLEARLQRADRMILSGLNEGQWPQPPSPDPWLAPGIRRRLGMPGLERQIGLAAHDFASALAAPEVILTRSLRAGSAPTIASRLRLRIDALMGRSAPGPGSPDFGAMARALDACDAPTPAERPRPAPPAALRPRRISVTQVDTLLADPYSYYAQAMLGLKRLDPLDADPTAAWRGVRVHDVLERWVKEGSWDPDAAEAMARDLLAEHGVPPLLRTLWGPRLLAALRWAAEQLVEQRREGRLPILAATEARAEWAVMGVTLSGKADRVDQMADGSLAIVDYKTGSGPSKAAVEAAYALQLGLLGAMAEAGAFKDVAEAKVSSFEYWRLKKRSKGDGFGFVETPFKAKGEVDASNFADIAAQRLRGAIAQYLTGDAPFVAKLVPQYAPYADYDQLMRLEEWYGRDAGPGAAP